MIDIAQQQGERVTVKAIAERQDISHKYAEQIIARLRGPGLVKSFRGTLGGYLLGRPADEISIGDVVRAVDDPYEASEDPRDEAIEAAFQQVLAAMWKVLDGLTLARVVEGQE